MNPTFREAQSLAHGLANMTGGNAYVVENAGRYFLADPIDLRVYHRRDIAQKQAHVVYIARPSVPTLGEMIDALVTDDWFTV